MGKSQLITYAKFAAGVILVVIAYDYAKTAYNKSKTATPAVTTGTGTATGTTAPKTT